MQRRSFLAGSVSAYALTSIGRAHSADQRKVHSVGVIGHTGRGNFGHGLDTVWLKIPGTRIAGVADADASGLKKAEQRLGTQRGFLDYKAMLAEAKPDIVAVCPRQPDQRRDMILAAIAAGAQGIYVEKPFCRTPAEADQIKAACAKHNVKLAVAHRNRYHPTLQAIDKLIADDVVGQVLEMRGRGKGDRRGGGEDLWVLGSHVMNLIHYFGGEPKSCSALIKQAGQLAGPNDVRQGNEALGLLVGDEVHARFDMSRGMVAYFDSLANDGTNNAGFGLQIIGSKAIVDINCDHQTLAHLAPGNPFQPTKAPRPWIPISSAGAGREEPRADLGEFVGHHVGPARDLLAAIAEDRPPLCDIDQAAMTVEMISSVFASHTQGGKAIAFPLRNRDNALTGWS